MNCLPKGEGVIVVQSREQLVDRRALVPGRRLKTDTENHPRRTGGRFCRIDVVAKKIEIGIEGVQISEVVN